jgi:hypothetical protein
MKHVVTFPPQDQDAFERAIAWLRRHDGDTEVERMLERDGFEYTGHTASYAAQCENLRLKPWEAPPCHVRGDVSEADPSVYGYRPEEIGLRDRLLAAGLSIYEPDPPAALARRGGA